MIGLSAPLTAQFYYRRRKPARVQLRWTHHNECVDDGPALTHLGAQDSLGEYQFAQDVSVSAVLSQLP